MIDDPRIDGMFARWWASTTKYWPRNRPDEKVNDELVEMAFKAGYNAAMEELY